MDLVFKVIHVVETAVEGLLPSAITGDQVYQWVRALQEHQLWPIGKRVQECSLSYVLDRMRAFREPWYALQQENAQLYKEPYLNVRTKLSDFRADLLSRKIGICLDCARTNGESATRGECRLKIHG